MGNQLDHDGVAHWEPNNHADRNDLNGPRRQSIQVNLLQFVPLVVVGALGTISSLLRNGTTWLIFQGARLSIDVVIWNIQLYQRQTR